MLVINNGNNPETKFITSVLRMPLVNAARWILLLECNTCEKFIREIAKAVAKEIREGLIENETRKGKFARREDRSESARCRA